MKSRMKWCLSLAKKVKRRGKSLYFILTIRDDDMEQPTSSENAENQVESNSQNGYTYGFVTLIFVYQDTNSGKQWNGE